MLQKMQKQVSAVTEFWYSGSNSYLYSSKNGVFLMIDWSDQSQNTATAGIPH